METNDGDQWWRSMMEINDEDRWWRSMMEINDGDFQCNTYPTSSNTITNQKKLSATSFTCSKQTFLKKKTLIIPVEKKHVPRRH